VIGREELNRAHVVIGHSIAVAPANRIKSRRFIDRCSALCAQQGF
jgi:hypothetical protein